MRKNVLLPLGMVSVLATGLLLPASRAQAAPAVEAVRPVTRMDPSGNAVGDPLGTSRLTREDSGISFVLTTSQLVPLNTYTAWWVLFTPDNKVLLARHASGAVALPDGTASFAGRLAVGPLPAVDGKIVLETIAGRMFDNPQTVTVAIILRDHGPIRLEQLAEQLTTFEGGCQTNTCSDVQIVTHAP